MDPFEIDHETTWLFVEANAILDTEITFLDTTRMQEASIKLTWTEAQRLHKWLGKRLSE